MKLLSFDQAICALAACVMAAYTAAPSDAKEVVIANSHPRFDSKTGNILELGDGSIAKFGDRYYLYGVKYVCTPSPVGPTQGCATTDRRIWGNMSIGIASSADMVTWELETYNAIPEMHDNTTVYPTKEYAWFMPTIVKNDTHYALWYYIDDFARGVAVSSSPTGPFKIVHDCIPNLQLGSDFFFWTGPDGHTYMKHNGGCGGDGTIIKPGGECIKRPQNPPERGQGVCVARLAPNMTDVVESSPKLDAPGEGGGIFEREGTWYIMQGHGCCFCKCGDDAVVFESKTGPFGPYTETNDLINCSKPDYSVGRNCGGPSTPERGPGAQQFGVFPIPQAGNTTAYLWVGIRYGSAPDGLKCHEYQYWDALEFDVAGHAKPLHYKANFTLNLLPPPARAAAATTAAASASGAAGGTPTTTAAVAGSTVVALEAAPVGETSSRTKGSAGSAGPHGPTPMLVYVNTTLVNFANGSSPGSAGNTHGYEDGSVRRVGNTTHLFVSELIGDPIWVKMQFGHWKTDDLDGATGWERVGTVQLDGAPAISTANCTDKVSHHAALWSPILYFEGNSWYMIYIAYNCPRNNDGQARLTQSVVPGMDGIGGPYKSIPSAGSPDGVLIARGAAGGNQSQPWEGWQGDDSFFPFHAPPKSIHNGDGSSSGSDNGGGGGGGSGDLLAFFGSSPFGWPWNVGLAKSESGTVVGPWKRLPAGNPLTIDGGKTENPIVLGVTSPAATPPASSADNSSSSKVLLMVHDWVTDGANGFGMSWSVDGYNWMNSTMVDVPGGCEAPMGILPSLTDPEHIVVWFNKRGRYDDLYVAQFKLGWQK